MTATTLTTTAATTRPVPSDRPQTWPVPANVEGVLERTREITDGHLTLSVYDSSGHERVAARKAVEGLSDPMAWFLRTVDATLRANSGHCDHLRLRIWERGGFAPAGAKFRAPDPSTIALPTAAHVPHPTASAVGSPATARPERHIVGRPRPEANGHTAPRLAPSAAIGQVDALRRELSQWKASHDTAAARAVRAEEELTKLKQRLRAKDAVIATLEASCSDLAEQRDEFEEQVANLARAVHELEVAWGQ